MNEVERGMQGVAEILRARNEEIVRLTTERDHYSAATGERRDAYNRAEEGRIKAVQACIDAEARIAELEAALREAIGTLERDGDEWGVCDRLRAALLDAGMTS